MNFPIDISSFGDIYWDWRPTLAGPLSAVTSASSTTVTFSESALLKINFTPFVQAETWEDLSFAPVNLILSGAGLTLDDTFMHFMKCRQIVTCCLSIYCILGNVSLLAFLLATPEFRSWQMFPVCLQSICDVIGPGVANLVNEIQLYSNVEQFRSNRYALTKSYVVSISTILDITVFDSRIACIVTHLRMLLNEYSTGVCVLATALFRYLIVCHPFYKPGEHFHRNVGVGIVLVICLAFVCSTIDIIFNNSYRTYLQMMDRREIHLFDEEFLLKCNSLVSRYTLRNVVEMGLFFLVPASLSGFFYYRVVRSLLQQEKRIGRNRALSIAFILSWFLWILCWTPTFVFGFTGFQKWSIEKSYGSNMDTFLSYFFVVKTPLQLLYSQLNVLIYIVVLQKFQDYHAAFFKKILKKFLYKPIVGSDENHTVETKLSENIPRVANQETLSAPREKVKKVSCVLICGVMVSLTVFIMSWQFAALGQTRFLNERVLRQSHSTSKAHLKGLQLANLGWHDLTRSDAMNDSHRVICAEQNGQLNFNSRRCFFQLEFSQPGRNFTLQVEECKNHGGILTYPRDEAELKFVWEFFEKQNPDLIAQDLAATFLHMGFVRIEGGATVPEREFVNNYASVDGKMTVNSLSHQSLFYRKASRILVPFNGVSICLTKTETFSACMPRHLTKYSICSVDFSY